MGQQPWGPGRQGRAGPGKRQDSKDRHANRQSLSGVRRTPVPRIGTSEGYRGARFTDVPTNVDGLGGAHTRMLCLLVIGRAGFSGTCAAGRKTDCILTVEARS